MISPAELEADMERMPGRPSVSPAGSTLYFKSDTMIYWTSIIKVSKKAEDTIFRYLRGLDFFEEGGLPKEEEQETGEDDTAGCCHIKEDIMGLPVLIYGKSGSGKSRSLKFFDEDEIVLLNTERKELPFKKRFKKTGCSDDINRIITTINQNPEKTYVIDDAGYIMTHLFMSQHRNKKGNASFEMYDDIEDAMYGLVKRIKTDVTVPDKIVYIMFHEDTDDFGISRLRTIGKQLDRKVCLEGMVTICIRCMSENGNHFFRTVTDGSDITKTPEEMFPEPEIENNLKSVDDTIRDFYGWEKHKTKEDKKS